MYSLIGLGEKDLKRHPEFSLNQRYSNCFGKTSNIENVVLIWKMFSLVLKASSLLKSVQFD